MSSVLSAPSVLARRPWRLVPHFAWCGYAVLLLVAPLVFDSGLAHTTLCQVGIGIIACLSYNILLGQGGMLSFGHAVYSGLGAFLAIHTLNHFSGGALHLPVSLVPLAGGLAAVFFAVLFGYLTTKKSGTTFAMITLGIGELVWALMLMFPGFSGGEAGVSGNRVSGEPMLGITWGPQIQLYYLIAAYALACTALMYAFTCTPLGRILNAVRDNPERVEFIGYDTRRVRYLAFIVSAFFTGISGGLAALNAEVVTAEVISTWRSGQYLLFTFLGGVGFFYGPIIGAVLMVLASVLLSELTKAWQLYMGVIFLLMVVYAPGGIASLIEKNLRLAARGCLRQLALAYAALGAAALVAFAGGAASIEMLYHRQMGASIKPTLRFAWLTLDTGDWSSWAGALLVFAIGLVLFELSRRHFLRRWAEAEHQAAPPAPAPKAGS